MKWTSENPALALKAPKLTTKPTLPFTDAEMKKLLAACDEYRGDKVRIKAFILVMRYSGLRIGDTIALRRDQLTGNNLFLYTQKTGQPVRVPLPDFVVEALKKIDNGADHFFWTGKNIRSAVANWSRYLASVFDLAKVKHAHSHRFRDTFATGLLLAGVPIEDVSILLGHSNTRITAKHYSPWVKERQQKLEDRVKQAWRLDGFSAERLRVRKRAIRNVCATIEGEQEGFRDANHHHHPGRGPEGPARRSGKPDWAAGR